MFIMTPWMQNKAVLKIQPVWAVCKCIVSIATHSGFEDGDVPKK